LSGAGRLAARSLSHNSAPTPANNTTTTDPVQRQSCSIKSTVGPGTSVRLGDRAAATNSDSVASRPEAGGDVNPAASVVGLSVGDSVGASVGDSVGDSVGASVGCSVGAVVGLGVGVNGVVAVGGAVGCGELVGA
jgi:hypothetical protein